MRKRGEDGGSARGVTAAGRNVDTATVQGFGEEWSHFDQSDLPPDELREAFDRYFAIFPWQHLPEGAEGFDAGCGSGRWASVVSGQVGRLHCIDASERALAVARRNLAQLGNCEFHLASVEDMPLEPASMDFGYSLGVLHHMPEPEEGLRACAEKLRPGAPFLVYLYYALENRPSWYRRLWKASNYIRWAVSRLPTRLRLLATNLIAGVVYWPLARLARAAEIVGLDVAYFPLSFYRHHSFYTMRTDALDRFGTRLEHRFTADQIRRMMARAGFRDVRFSDSEPFWCAVGFRE